MWQRPRNHYARDFPAARVPRLRRLLAFQKTLVKTLADASVPILLGTDAGSPIVAGGFSAMGELRELVSAGLTPYAALRAATVDAARFLRKDAELGTIEAGKSADFVLLRGDPLSDVENVALRGGVMLRGRWLDNAALNAELDRIARVNRAEEPVVRAMERGADAVLAALKTTPVREATLNELAYQLLRAENKPAEALKLFRANAKLHPRSREARESLEEGLSAARAARPGSRP
jgi:adenine deaminase